MVGRPPSPSGVIFDFDGTLVDDVALLLDAARVTLRSAGFEEAAAADFEALREMPPRQALEAARIPIRAVPGLIRGLRREMRKRVDEIELDDDACQFLDTLHRSGSTLGIMSSNSPSLIRSVVQRADVAHCFEFVARGGAVRNRATRLRRVTRRASATVRTWVFVGDEIRDFEASRVCGVPFVGVGWGVSGAAALTAAGAGSVAADWPQLAAMLESFRSAGSHADTDS